MTVSPQDLQAFDQPQIVAQGLTGAPQQQPGVVVEKPRSDVYTVLLVIALLALGLGITCLALEMEAYQWNYKPEPAGGATSWIAPDERTVAAAAGSHLSEVSVCHELRRDMSVRDKNGGAVVAFG